jgi:hypothetical protein
MMQKLLLLFKETLCHIKMCQSDHFFQKPVTLLESLTPDNSIVTLYYSALSSLFNLQNRQVLFLQNGGNQLSDYMDS